MESHGHELGILPKSVWTMSPSPEHRPTALCMDRAETTTMSGTTVVPDYLALFIPARRVLPPHSPIQIINRAMHACQNVLLFVLVYYYHL